MPIAPQRIDGVKGADRSVTVDLSRAAVKAAPPYEPSAAPDRKRETELYSHCGRPPYWAPGSTLEREI
ncbi:MAG: hypothetical protein ABIX46_08815 [Burkholderiaceae bacterium]